MPVTLNIIAEDAAGLVDEFRRLNELTSATTVDAKLYLDTLPLNDFIEMANARLAPDHFKIVDAMPAEPEPAPEPTPELAPKTAKKTKESTVEAGSPAGNVEEFPAPRRAKKPEIDNLRTIAEAPDAESAPEGDRQHVLDTLAGILRDPSRKAEVLAFTGKQAKLQGTEKISELPAAPFPSIRREMEKAFPDVRSSA